EAGRGRLPEVRMHELVRQLLAERHPQLHLDEIDADRMTHEIRHLPAGDPRRALDDDDAAVRPGDQLWERDARAESERVDRVHGYALRFVETVAVHGRRVDVDPPDAEPDPRRTQPVRERQRNRLAVAGDHDSVHLDALDELLEDRLPGRRRGKRLMQVTV